jgi:hypothetical protein
VKYFYPTVERGGQNLRHAGIKVSQVTQAAHRIELPSRLQLFD